MVSILAPKRKGHKEVAVAAGNETADFVPA